LADLETHVGKHQLNFQYVPSFAVADRGYHTKTSHTGIFWGRFNLAAATDLHVIGIGTYANIWKPATGADGKPSPTAGEYTPSTQGLLSGVLDTKFALRADPLNPGDRSKDVGRYGFTAVAGLKVVNENPGTVWAAQLGGFLYLNGGRGNWQFGPFATISAASPSAFEDKTTGYGIADQWDSGNVPPAHLFGFAAGLRFTSWFDPFAPVDPSGR
jgi:hypothetical protein